MAQMDSGLGWSAKEEWMVVAANYLLGTASNISGANMLVCPEAINWTPEAVIREGIKYGHNNGNNTDNYILSRYGEVLIAFNNQDDYETPIAISTSSSIECMICGKTQAGTVNGTWTFSDTYYDSATGLYWAKPSSLPRSHIVDVPPYTNRRAMLDAVTVVSASFNKASQGYAVGCIAKWKTDNNVLFTTPVLISSETENTDMTCTSSAYSLAKLNIRYDGMQFYMSFFDVVDMPINSDLEVADLSMFKLELNQVFNLIAQSGMANIQVTETVDPYEDFGYTEEDAGEINPEPQDDDVDFDDLPTKSFATAGFCRIYNPDVSDLNDLASYMWTDQNFLQTVINHLKQILENPIEAIISLSMVPVQPPVGPSKVPVNVMFINTGVSMRPVTSQFVTIDCGTTVLQECYGGALDYNPYTRVQIYLPYIGTVQLDTDEVMAKTLHLQYHIDVVTGICCAEIKADGKLLYSFSGHCAVSQPITSADFSSYLNAAVAAAKVAVGVATGSAEVTASAAAAQAPPEVSGSTRGSQSLALVPSSPGPIGPHLGSPGGSHAWTDFSNIPEPSGGNNISWGELAKPGNINTVASAMGGKMVVQHSGGFSGNSGYLAKRRPYLIIIRPRIANPRNYAQHFGRTSMEYLNLGSCTGYTKVQSVHLSGFDATNPELSEISSLLKGGVLM